jgi:secreted trypsin-like serine protease
MRVLHPSPITHAQGDSGGPLVYNAANPGDPEQGPASEDYLIGLVDAGIGCGLEDPGTSTYTAVPLINNWIQEQLTLVRCWGARMRCPADRGG